MASRLKKNGKWMYRGRVKKDGKALDKWFLKKRDALSWEAGQRAASWRIDTGLLTLHELATEYLDFAQTRFVHDVYVEKRRSFKHLLAFLEAEGLDIRTFPAGHLTPDLAQRHLIDQAMTRPGGGVNNDKKNLAAAWKWATQFKELTALSPFTNIKDFPVESKKRYVPPEDDFWAVYGLTEGQDRVMLSICIYAAPRRSEVFRLTWSDIDFGANVIAFGTRKREGGGLEYDRLPMAAALRKELLWWWENRTFKESEYVFLNESREPYLLKYCGKPFRERRRFLPALCAKAGVKPFGFHGIRHLTSTILYHAGEPLSVIQAVLRHKHPRTTELYLHRLGLGRVGQGLDKIRQSAEVISLNNRRDQKAGSQIKGGPKGGPN